MYRTLAVKIQSKHATGAGSGMLFQPATTEYTYVLTAKHCLTSDKTKKCFDHNEIQEIEIFRDASNENSKLQIIDCHVHSDPAKDFAVIRIKFVDAPKIVTGSVDRNENNKVLVFGYPKIYANQENPALAMNADVVDLFRDGQFEIATEQRLDSFLNQARTNVEGISGSGVYRFIGANQYVLVGVLYRLKDTQATFDRLICYGITEISNFLQDINLANLSSVELNNFNYYLEGAFSSYGERAQYLLNAFFTNGIQEIHPQFLIDKLGGKLFLPNEREVVLSEKIASNVLWAGWIKLLTYVHVGTGAAINQQNLDNHVHLGNDERKPIIRFFYSESHMADAIKYIFDKLYDEFSWSDQIIFNTGRETKTKKLTPQQLANITNQIDNPGLTELRFRQKGIDITSPETYKDLTVMHIDLIDTTWEGIEYAETHKIEEIIINGIKGVYDSENGQ